MKSTSQSMRLASLIFCVVFLFAVPGQAGAYQRPGSILKSARWVGQRSPDTTIYTLSIPAAAFRAQYETQDFENKGGRLRHIDNSGHSGGIYQAAVFMPNSATVTRVTFYFMDNLAAQNAYFYLTRAGNADNSVDNLASLVSNDSASSVSTTAFSYPIINNFTYMYYLTYVAPYSSSPDTSNVSLYGVKIEYSLPLFAPATDYRSLPAAGFIPYSGDYWYANRGRELNFMNESGLGTGDFQAPLFLPDRANIHDATFYYFDNHVSKGGEAHLNSTDLAGGWPELGSFFTSGSPGYSHDSHSFSYEINNATNAYWTFFRLPSSSSEVMGKSLVVSFSYPTTFSILDHISVPAGAFVPEREAQDYENHGRFLKHFGGTDNIYVAPITLPQGERIKRMTFYYDQIGAGHAYALLQASLFNNMTWTLASIESGGTGFTSTSQMLPEEPFYIINNLTSVYWVKFILPVNDVWPCGVVVETSDRLVYLPAVQK
jgi:hypothetical protein